MKTTRIALTLPIACLAAIVCANTWVPTDSGTYDFNDPANWVENAVPNGIDAVADIAINIAGGQTINLNEEITLGTLKYGDTSGQSGGQNLAVGTDGSLIMSVSSGHALIQRKNGNTSTASTFHPDIRLDSTIIIDNSNVGGAYEMRLGGAISGEGGLIKTNAARFILGFYSIQKDNTYTGLTTIAGGRIELDKNNRIAIPGDVLIYNSAMLYLGRHNNIADTSVITLRDSGKFRLTPPATPSGAFSDTIGAIEGDSPLTVVECYATSGTSALTLLDDGDRTYAGTLQDGGRGGILAIVKQGAGHWTLTGTNTHSGTTTISGAGSIVVNSPAVMANSPVQLTLGGTLGGDGVVSQLVTCVNGRLAPGARGSVGTLTLAGGLDATETLVYDWQLAELSATGGFDMLVASAGTIASDASCTVWLDFTLLSAENRPDAPELAPFWRRDRCWTIAVPAGGTDTVPFSEVGNGTGWAGGRGSFSLSGDGDGAVVLCWTAPPPTGSIVILK